MNKNVKLLLLDSNSLVNRAYHALPLSMSVNDNLYTNAIYGFMSMFLKLLSSERPTHICAVFDCKAKTFRHYMSPDYKATRKPMPEELSMQMPILQELLKKMGIKILFKEGYEADDILGTLAKKFEYPTYIVTGDRDCLQLVDEYTYVFMMQKGISNVKAYSLDTLALENLTPQQIIEYKGLAGDSSDNISGCPGIGDKTAKNLLSQYDNIDTIYSSIDELPEKLRTKLLENKETVLLSKKLATIDVNADIQCELSDLEFDYNISQEAIALMCELKFKTLIDKYINNKNESVLTYKEINETETKLQVSEQITSKPNIEVIEIKDEEELKKIVDLFNPGEFIFTEFQQDSIFIGTNEKCYKILTSYNMFSEGVPDYTVMEILKPLFDDRYTNIFFDVKKYIRLFVGYNISINKPYEDIMLSAYLINNSKVFNDLSQLLEEYGYANEEIACALPLFHDLQKKLQEKNLLNLYYNVELPLVEVLYDMEKNGFKIDLNILNSLNNKFTDEINVIEKEIFDIAGKVFNINSTKQLSDVLFNDLQLKPTKKTKTGFSVDAASLEEIEHPIVTAILRYRELTKLKSTYIVGMKNLINPASEKVHTTFNQCITSTGRLSSTEPNLQNIPIRKAVGKEIRKMFISENGQLVSADYSQIELRLLAHYSNEENLINAYRENKDIHAITASEIFNVDCENITEEMRSAAKAVNFGIIYGISGFGLSKNANISRAQAKTFIEQYFNKYPGVKKFMDGNVELAQEQGYLTSLLGRIRYFPELKSSNRNIREFGKRAAMNLPLQGSASDIIKMAMINVYRELKNNNLRSKLILQVHDELIIDAFEDEIETVKRILKEKMENVLDLKVPLSVNIASGKTWYDAK